MDGTIIKALAGFYYVKGENMSIYECKPRGVFRNGEMVPLVGDNVVFDVLDSGMRTGVITGIRERKNMLIRPNVANVDQVMVVMAVRDPYPNLSILDRFLVLMKKQGIETFIVFNKKDLARVDDVKNLKKIYKGAGYKVFFTDMQSEKPNTFFLKWKLRKKMTVVTGPSGVGKSTLINTIAFGKGSEQALVGEISKKTGRGKNTTRCNEVFSMKGNIDIIDTPGFSALLVNSEDVSREELAKMFPEFEQYSGQCKFSDCAHIKDKDCAVVAAVNEGKIPTSRYNSYKAIYGELKTK